MFKNTKTALCIIMISLFALASTSFAESWPNLHYGNTLIKQGQLRIVDGDVTIDQNLAVTGTNTMSNALVLDGALYFGTDTITMTSGDPGHGTITASATGAISYYIITDATGSLADQLDVGDGITVGQQLRVTLLVDGETTGLKIVPTNKLVGTSTLLEAAGDVMDYEWTGSQWHVVSNIGGSEL